MYEWLIYTLLGYLNLTRNYSKILIYILLRIIFYSIEGEGRIEW